MTTLPDPQKVSRETERGKDWLKVVYKLVGGEELVWAEALAITAKLFQMGAQPQAPSSPRARAMAMELSAAMRQQSLQIVELLEEGTPQESVAPLQKLLLSNLVQLRAANRNEWQQSKASKVKTAEAKAGIDSLNLELQGLYYEQEHLKNEIKLCQETPTIYDQIPLIDEEEFLQTHPEAAELNPRDLMHARLGHEKEERLRLEEVRRELMAKKSALIAENKKRKGDLESLEKQLNTFISSAENISAIFKKY